MNDANQPQQPSKPPQNGGAPAQDSQSGDKEVIIGKYKVKVVRDGCIGAASCVALAAATFKLDDENKAVILEGSEDAAESILMAAQSCPTKAIIITDTETGKQVWPE
jgi:ferredoxin